MNEKCGLTSNTIKVIAIIAMTIDHVAWVFLPGYRFDGLTIFMHIIGRLTAPLMLFFITEGYYYTNNIKKYTFRLFVFAIISHFAFVFAFGKPFIPLKKHYFVFDQTSIIWTLMLGLIALSIIKSEISLIINEEKLKITDWKKYILVFIIILAAFPANWSSTGALAVLLMGINHDNFKKQILSLVLCMTIYAIMYSVMHNIVYGLIQMMTILSIPILYYYNGKRGVWKGMKWFFYIYYPLHLTVLGFIRVFNCQIIIKEIIKGVVLRITGLYMLRR
jgi:hypothetical protein